jgi:hypothetical protein
MPVEITENRDVNREGAGRIETRSPGEGGSIKKETKSARTIPHRITAEYAGADWVWEARLRTAEDLERRAAVIRKQLPDDGDTAENNHRGAHEERACQHPAGRPPATLA